MYIIPFFITNTWKTRTEKLRYMICKKQLVLHSILWCKYTRHTNACHSLYFSYLYITTTVLTWTTAFRFSFPIRLGLEYRNTKPECV